MADDDQFEIRILMKNGASTYFSVSGVERANDWFKAITEQIREAESDTADYLNLTNTDGVAVGYIPIRDISSVTMGKVDVVNKDLQRRLLVAQVKYWEAQASHESWKEPWKQDGSD